MLKSLSVKNFALIEDAQIEFGSGLNIFTGETGAGKSILVGAMSMILGDRASMDLIRTGSERAVLEAVFDLTDGVRGLLQSEGIESQQGEILIRREISIKGQNRCFANDNLITNNALRLLGEALVDLHGQHEHQSLLRTQTHIGYLDAFAGNQAEIDTCRQHFLTYNKLRADLNELLDRRRRFQDDRDLFNRELKEILAVEPVPNEDESLLEEERVAGSAERLAVITQRIYQSLYDTDESITSQLAALKRDFEDLKTIDGKFGPIVDQFDNAMISLEEVSRWVGDYRNRISFDPDRLEEIRQRQLSIQRLKKKFGTIDDILKRKAELQEALRVSESFEEVARNLENQVRDAVKSYLSTALGLSKLRKQAAPALQQEIIGFLKQLGMHGTRFEVAFDEIDEEPPNPASLPASATQVGLDKIEFMLSANPGEPPRALAKIASGGEISRIMLALKSALAKADQIPTLVFDEIDVGISGRIAQAVGEALCRLSKTHQVICITHLPQIAGFADRHYSVSKLQSSKAAQTVVEELSGEARVVEIAKLLGGREITPAALENARSLMHSV
ncbi:MAG: DNA repair protein RecN [Bacteroidetes bacterium]|nr:DNA repair protein RecN [Bacteroidota bacterium]